MLQYLGIINLGKWPYFLGVGTVEPDAPVNEAPLHVFIKIRSNIKLEPS